MRLASPTRKVVDLPKVLGTASLRRATLVRRGVSAEVHRRAWSGEPRLQRAAMPKAPHGGSSSGRAGRRPNARVCGHERRPASSRGDERHEESGQPEVHRGPTRQPSDERDDGEDGEEEGEGKGGARLTDKINSLRNLCTHRGVTVGNHTPSRIAVALV